MKWTNSIFAVMASVLFLLGCSGSTPPNEMQETPFVVRNVQVFDGETVTENRTVLVQDGVIHEVGSDDLAIPAGTEIIDGSGRTCCQASLTRMSICPTTQNRISGRRQPWV